MTNDNDNTGKAEKDFLAEAEEIIDRLSLDLVGLSDSSETGECNPELLNSIFRGAHSLKGLAGMFGFTDLAELAHNLENLLDSLRLGKITLSQSTLNVLFDSMDILGTLVRDAGSGESREHDVAPAIERINSCVTATSPAETDSPLAKLGLPQKALNALTEYEEHRLLENVKKGRNHLFGPCASFSLDTFDQELAELTELLKSRGEVISTLPSAGAGHRVIHRFRNTLRLGQGCRRDHCHGGPGKCHHYAAGKREGRGRALSLPGKLKQHRSLREIPC